MNLADKIDQIRQKPEHIRMRYVWGCVAVSMFFVIVLWIFSLTGGRVSNNNETNFSGGEILQKFQTQKQSMEDYKSQLNDMQNSFKDLQNQASDQKGTTPDSSEQGLGQETIPNLQDNLGN